jgi:hypothetical protein
MLELCFILYRVNFLSTNIFFNTDALFKVFSGVFIVIVQIFMREIEICYNITTTLFQLYYNLFYAYYFVQIIQPRDFSLSKE